MPPLSTLLPPRISTPRLTLILYSETNPSHVTRLHELITRPSTTGFAGQGPKTIADLHAYNRSTRLRRAAFSSRPDFAVDPVTVDVDIQYLIFAREAASDTDALLGSAGVRQRSPRLKPDLGFGIAEEVRGRGYAGEAVAAVLAAVTTPEVGVAEVEARVMLGNDASVHLCRKLGFVDAGMGRLADGREHFRFVLPGMDTTQSDVPVVVGGEEDEEED